MMKNYSVATSLVVWMVLLFSLAPSLASAANYSQLVPRDVHDSSGNKADENSDIIFATLKTNVSSGTSQCSQCVGDGGIRPFLNMAQGFAHVVLPGSYPFSLVKEIKDGKLISDYKAVIMDHIGFIVCVAIGFLFILIFPIIGVCYCCAKCCDSRKTDGRVKEGCTRPCMMTSLLILSAIVGTGGIIAVLTNNSISDGIKGFDKDVPANLDSLVDYLKDTVKEIEDIATTDFNFTRDVLFRDLDNIGFLVGTDVKEVIKKEMKVDDIKTTVLDIEGAMLKLLSIVPKIDNQTSDVSQRITAYANAMSAVEETYRNNMTTAGLTVASPGINQTVDPNQFPVLTGLSNISDISNANLSKLLDDSMKKMDDIPEKVHNKSATQVSDLKKSITRYTSDVTDITDKLDIDDKIDKKSIQDEIGKYTEIGKKYDKYRWYAGLGLGCLVLFIVFLFVCGLLCGCTGGNGSIPPHERGCGSNCGGNTLVASSIIFFTFGFLLMLITTILFTIGTPVEDFFCVAVEDPSIIDKLMNEYEIFGSVDGSGNYLANMILDDPNKNLTFSEILTACKKHKTTYATLKLNESSLLNLTDILDYKSKFSVDTTISSISVDFKDINILSTNLENNLQELNNSVQYDLSKYENELNRDATKEATDFQIELKNNVTNAINPVKGILTDTIDRIQHVLNNEGKELNDSTEALKVSVAELADVLTPANKLSISDKITKLHDQVNSLDGKLKPVANASLTKAIKTYSERLFRVTDSFIDHLLDALNNNIGSCYPMWDFYNTMLNENLCGTLIGSMNGFWFAIGWSLFFLVPSLIIAIKLSSHFRRMNYVPGDDHEMDTLRDSRGAPQHFPPNKVGPIVSQSDYATTKW